MKGKVGVSSYQGHRGKLGFCRKLNEGRPAVILNRLYPYSSLAVATA